MSKKPPKRSDVTRNLRQRYIIALSIIAVLIISSQAFIQLAIKNQEADSRIINIAGRQRMLSQRITKAVYGIYVAKNPTDERAYQEELVFSLDLWQRSHVGLLQGDSELGLPGKNSGEVRAKFRAIEANYLAIITAAEYIQDHLSAGDLTQPDFYRQLLIIRENEKTFLRGMDDIVFQYDKEAKTKVNSIKYLELILLLVTLVALFMEARFIFIPAEKKIESALQELHEHEELLQQHATYDDMTGLVNRRTGLLILEKEMAQAKRNDNNLTICFIDIDGLKLVNDKYTHLEGDWLIKKATSILLEGIREVDTAFRFGGDEFIIIFPDTSSDEAEKVIKRIYDSIDEANKISGKPYKIGISHGNAEYKIVLPSMVDYFTNYADQKMYENKMAKKKSIDSSTV